MEKEGKDYKITIEGLDWLDTKISLHETSIIGSHFSDELKRLFEKKEKIQ